MIEITEENYRELKGKYERNKGLATSFPFQGHEILVSYAKYLLEYMEDKLNIK